MKDEKAVCVGTQTARLRLKAPDATQKVRTCGKFGTGCLSVCCGWSRVEADACLRKGGRNVRARYAVASHRWMIGETDVKFSFCGDKDSANRAKYKIKKVFFIFTSEVPPSLSKDTK